MKKAEAIAIILEATGDTPVVFTTGYSCRIARSISDRASNFYMTGSMGLAADIGIGIALALGRTTVVVDGDGSLAMNPSCLLTAGALSDLPLLHIVLNDGVYASTGGQPSPTLQADFCALARSAGYGATYQAATSAALERFLESQLRDCAGPTLIQCAVSPQLAAPPPRIDIGLAAHAERFSQYLQGLTSTNSSDRRSI